MLPDDFTWQRLTGPDDIGKRWMYVGEKCVAVVTQRIDGLWNTTVDRHLEVARWKHATCRSREQGTRWVERWAGARVDRLRRQPLHAAPPPRRVPADE